MDINVHLEMVYKFFDKKASGGAATLPNKSAIKNENNSNKELAEELHKPIIRKINKGKVHTAFIDNICSADLVDMQLISKFNKGFRFLLCVIDIYSKHTWVILLKDKKGITITNDFQKMLDETNRKSNKTWVDKGSEFYNRSMKSLLQNNDIEMYSQHNEGKSVVAERFIRTLKNIIYKCLYCKLDDKYNNTYHNTVKMKPVDVKSSAYNDSSKENNNKDPKFKIGDIVRISKY